jgi:hypothetical protein
MATARSGRSRQHEIRIIAPPRKEIDLKKLALVVFELTKQMVAEEREQERLATKRLSPIRPAQSLHRRGSNSKPRTLQTLAPDQSAGLYPLGFGSCGFAQCVNRATPAWF